MTAPLRIVFAGTPQFAVPSLRAAARLGEIVAVYTQPDRPAGRGRAVALSPIKREAVTRGWEARQPESLRTIAARDALRALQADLLIVVAYGLILPPKILSVPRLGCWNVHASLLPRWRGAAPIQRAIEAGDAATGVCLMQMDAGLDTGPVLLSQSTPIRSDDTSGSLHAGLAELGAEVLTDGLILLRAGVRPVAQPQPAVGITYAHKLEKTEARLDWAQPAMVLERKVRAFSPWPIAEADINGERLRIHAAIALDISHDSVPGGVLAATRDGLDIACGSGVLRLLSVQRDGGRAQTIAEYINARGSRQR